MMPATGSVGFVSGVVDDCCDFSHSTSTTAAIVVLVENESLCPLTRS